MEASIGVNTSLYIGELAPSINEERLFRLFGQFGPILSIRVCRDAISRNSLGYAYVNFQERTDAERALETLQYEEFEGRCIRVLWSHRDPASRRCGKANVFLKNLEQSIDERSLHDTLSSYGKVICCKIARDQYQLSKGYGYIQFSSEEDAQKAIGSINGMEINGKKVIACEFRPRPVRGKNESQQFHNLYIKNFGLEFSDEALRNLFASFGPITSCKIMRSDAGKSKGFGFVCFEKHEDAKQAVEAMDGYVLPVSKHELTVTKAQLKREREAELRRRFGDINADRRRITQGRNLYVKNLDSWVDEHQLKLAFAKYGTIESAKVVLSDGSSESRGFGFVCFKREEEATRALLEMKGQMLGSKPIYVALAQRRADRVVHLASMHLQRVNQMRMQAAAAAVSSGGGAGVMYAPTARGQFATLGVGGGAPPAFTPNVHVPFYAPRPPIPPSPAGFAGRPPPHHQQQQQSRYDFVDGNAIAY